MDKSKLAVALFNKFAQAYQEKYMDQTRYYDSLNEFCAWIRPMSARLLELACGPGNVTKYLLEQRPDLQILATDLAPNMLQLAQKSCPQANFQLLDVRQIDQLNQTFDAIICAFGLPYLNKEETIGLIAKIARQLNPYGVCYLSTMEGNYQDSDWQGSSTGTDQRIFIHYHELDYLQTALTDHGLQVQLVDRIEYQDAQDKTVTDLVLIATKM